MVSLLRLRLPLAVAICVAMVGPLHAEPKNGDAGAQPKAGPTPPAASTGQDEEEDAPTPAPLTVGSMAVASDASLVVQEMAVDIAIDHVTYAYKFRNKGTAKLALAASVALPDLEVNNEGTTFYDLPSHSPANPVDLTVQVDGQPVQKTQYMQAVALGIDRLADLKAEKLPLIPFGDDIDKALAAAKPETLTKLESLGLVTPRDPAQPDTPVIADWSLHTTLGWTLSLDPGATSNVTVSFAPIKAVYTIDATSLSGFDALKAQVCLTPQIMSAAQGLLKTKGSTVDVSDLTLANDGPARWLDNPAATVAIRKPQPASIVAFCGMDAATAGQPVVKGKMPGSSDAAGLRVLIFTPAAK